MALKYDGSLALTGYEAEKDSSSEYGRSVTMFDPLTSVEIRHFSKLRHRIEFLSFSPSGTHIVATSIAGDVVLWESATTRVAPSWHAAKPGSVKAVFSADGKCMIAATRDEARVWRLDGKELCRITERGEIVAADLSHDGTCVAMATKDDTVALRDVSSDKRMPVELRGGQVAFCPDSSRVVTGNAAGLLRVWNTDTGFEERRILNPGPVANLIVSADGKRCLTLWSFDRKLGYDGTRAVIWNLDSGKSILEFWEERRIPWLDSLPTERPSSATFVRRFGTRKPEKC